MPEIKDYTPAHRKCAVSMGGPSIHKLEDGRLVIVGDDCRADVVHGNPRYAGIRVGDDEAAVVIPPDLLDEIKAESGRMMTATIPMTKSPMKSVPPPSRRLGMSNKELIEKLRSRTVRRLPTDWKDGRDCPECGTAALRPKCMWDLGGGCPRNDPENYEPSPYVTESDPVCLAAAEALSSAEAEIVMLREEAGKRLEQNEILAEQLASAMLQIDWLRTDNSNV